MGEYNYSGEHSATFGEKNTWNDWKLVPTSLLIPSAPQPKTEFVDIPGADGQLDYTEVLAGIKYQPRQGSFEFYVMNSFSSWAERYSEVMAYLHGKRMRLIISDDPNYYYMGRFAVNEFQSDEHWSKLVIDYVLDPYKLPVSGTADYDWLWNELFSNTIYYGKFDVIGSKVRTLINDAEEPVGVAITVSSPMTIKYGGETIQLQSGTTKDAITIRPGDNRMTFIGNGRVVVDYSEGRKL